MALPKKLPSPLKPCTTSTQPSTPEEKSLIQDDVTSTEIHTLDKDGSTYILLVKKEKDGSISTTKTRCSSLFKDKPLLMKK